MSSMILALLFENKSMLKTYTATIANQKITIANLVVVQYVPVNAFLFYREYRKLKHLLHLHYMITVNETCMLSTFYVELGSGIMGSTTIMK